MEAVITTYCRIKNNAVWVNDKQIIERQGTENVSEFLGELYKTASLNYSKFFKMDKLSKLATLATEFLIRATPDFDNLPKNEMALLFSNQASSIDSDRIHLQAIADKQNYFPSPSVFVYTLPNILIGEIAVKHKITGENAFFISENFDHQLMYDYCNILLQNGEASSAICGWINVDENTADGFVYCVKNLNFKQESRQAHITFDPQNIQQLYHS